MNTALYYPQLYPPARTLKLAALCWDRLYVAVPAYAPAPPSAIGNLDRKLGGVLQDVSFSQATRSREVRDEFERWLDARPEVLRRQELVEATRAEHEVMWWALMPGKGGDQMESIFRRLEGVGLARRDVRSFERRMPEWEREAYEWNLYAESPAVPPEGPLWEHYRRLREDADEASDELTRVRLEQEASEFRERHMVTFKDSDERLFVPKWLALHYLALCAAHIAGKDKRDLLASKDIFTDVVFNEARIREAQVSTAVVEALLPVDLDKLEPGRIAVLRDELRLARRGHFEQVQSFVEEFDRIASVGEFERLERDAVEQARLAATQAKRAYRHARLEVASKAVGLSITPPTLAAATASLLGIGLIAPAGIVLALSLVGAEAFLRFKERGQPLPERWSYSVQVARRLT